MIGSPRVSVIMPAYNACHYIGAAIESILGQSFQDFEFIVIDDGSIDRTLEIAGSYRDRRIRVLHNPANLRLSATLNRGLDESRTDLIARMDADDIAHPERLARQVAFMDRNPDVAVLGSALRRFDNTGATRSVVMPVSDPDLLRWRHLFSNQIAHPTVMLRRRALEEQGLRFGVVPEWTSQHCDLAHVAHLSEDYLLFGLLALRCKVTNLPEVLLDMRVHAASVSNVAVDAQLATARRVSGLLFSTIVGHPVDRTAVNRLYFTGGSVAGQSGMETQAAAQLLDEAFDATTRRYQPARRAQIALKRDVALRHQVLRAGERSMATRILSLMAGPRLPRDAEESRLMVRSLVSESTVDRLKTLRTAGLTALRGLQRH